ncbi:MAG TPA: hypothetical protein VGF99_11230, partial [Myxococcota bacterium]
LLGCSVLEETATDDGGFETPDAGAEGIPDVGGRCGTPFVVDSDTCGACEVAGDICGSADVAICESRENSAGRTCQLCVTATGTILYNDCLDSDDVGAAFCELTPGRSDDEVCRSCFDATGSIISVGCGPSADRCETNVDVDGQLCNRCYDGDTLVSTVCAPADIEPRRCERYGNEQGTCIDCYGDDATGAEQLLLHDCRFASRGEANDSASCETRFRAGLSCTTCVDALGQQLSQVCRDDVPASDRCEQLSFAEQTCVVCVDPDDVIVFVDCVDPDCAVSDTCRADSDCSDDRVCFDGRCVGRSGSRGGDGEEGNEGESEPGNEPALGACSEPPPCFSSRDDDGALCRTCTSGAGVTETQCLSSSSLTCTTVDEAALPPSAGNVVDEVDDGAAESPGDGPSPQGRQCVLCSDRDSGVEVYRDCAVVPPPYCTSVDVDGARCDACYDAVDNSLVYSRCDDDVCFAQRDVTLRDDDGVALAVDRVTAVAACQQCGGDTTCALRGRCDDALGGASADACTATTSTTTTTLPIYPRRCDNVWSAWRDSTDKRDDLAGLMGWALDTQQLQVLAATTSAAAVPACSARDCSCARGDRVELVLNDGDVERARRAFAGLLAP